ncbi:PREDICTED: putative F-box protein PP2-B12 [Nelumbo nucifera]|uniref:F-box protein PP2-B12 n=2 Tax=Nelumbo nucifera TaxID=4432 RepID=A0A1U8Q5P6_NELNU|nr:PREDICTED: putative F-box protein PP2-B12 [Nelumbo nucifera]DAD36999.1 TPA_asm: hypothetical protein HUJ06_007640 [Nelumbo nucifera]
MVTGFNVLPLECISKIISFTSPLEACRSSAVSLIFRSAADSDSVWEKFLPSDYKNILSRSVSSVDFSSKKELYFRLCDDPILIDDGYMSFALDKLSGRKCYTLGARRLSIAWGGSTSNWTWPSVPESRFGEVAHLEEVCWLQIDGKVDTRMLSPETTYIAKFIFKFAEGSMGFDYQPVDVVVKFVGGGRSGVGTGKVQTAYLDPDSRKNAQFGRLRNTGLFQRTLRLSTSIRPPIPIRLPQQMLDLEGQFPEERGDGWLEVQMGEFYIGKGEDGEVQMSLLEVKGGHWKSGLNVQGIELRPKETKIPNK